MIRAVVVKDILWPQKQEDRDEGGWKSEKNETAPEDTAPRDRQQVLGPEFPENPFSNHYEHSVARDPGPNHPCDDGAAEFDTTTEAEAEAHATLPDQSIRTRRQKQGDDIV